MDIEIRGLTAGNEMQTNPGSIKALNRRADSRFGLVAARSEKT